MSSMNMKIDTGGMDMGGMDMGGMGDMNATPTHPCKISMLWNWNTVDACFLSESWQVRSQGGFAGLCIGVVLVVILLEFLRYAAKQYDLYIASQNKNKEQAVAVAPAQSSNRATTSDSPNTGTKEQETVAQTSVSVTTPSRPSIFQQVVRALFHTLQFATAYWVMLLAMYYNGYIIICIFIGAFIGFFIFQWDRLQHRSDGVANSGPYPATVCCCT